MKTNTICDVCGKDFYKRPSHKSVSKHHFCTKKCYTDSRKIKVHKKCKNINCAEIMILTPSLSKRRKYCSKKCMGQVIGKSKGTKNYGYKNIQKILLEKIGVNECQIDKCDYNRAIQLHRWPIQGKDGGKYEVGNIVVLCPNHHIEYHTGWIDIQEKDGKFIAIKLK